MSEHVHLLISEPAKVALSKLSEPCSCPSQFSEQRAHSGKPANTISTLSESGAVKLKDMLTIL